jgi:Flp pilus assembly protein TadG
MVTAELACALPVLVLVALAMIAGLQVAQAQLRCADAAREAARALARGDSASIARLARAAAGGGVTVGSSRQADLTTVTVALQVRPLPWIGPVTLTETAVVATEPAAQRAGDPMAVPASGAAQGSGGAR